LLTLTRVARFFYAQRTETEKNKQIEHEMYQRALKYTKCLKFFKWP
jgi:hypothetical protein